MSDIDKLLGQPLDRKNVSQRQQGNTTLSYIAGHHAIREANRIFGYDGWKLSVESFDVASKEEYEKPAYNSGDPPIPMHRICVCAVVTIEALGVKRTDVGYGEGSAKTLSAAHESAGKEAVTDAMKRAFRTFGDQFGNALYDKQQKHVADEVADPVILKLIDECNSIEDLGGVWKGVEAKHLYTDAKNNRKAELS